MFANIYILGYCDKKQSMSCIIYEFNAGRVIPASQMTNLITKDIKIEILCHVKPKDQSFTTCDLLWKDIQTGYEDTQKLETLEGEAMVLVHLSKDDTHHLLAWSYFTFENCLIMSSRKFNNEQHKHTVGLLKVNKGSKIKVTNFFSSHQRHGNYTRKEYSITFDGKDFAVDIKTEKLPPSYFGQH